MARVLFWSSSVCSFCILLATFVRCRHIASVSSESARREIEPMPLLKVRERSYRDGPVRHRVKVRRAAPPSGKAQNVGAIETSRVGSTLKIGPAISPATTTPPPLAAIHPLTTTPPPTATTTPPPPTATTPPPSATTTPPHPATTTPPPNTTTHPPPATTHPPPATTTHPLAFTAPPPPITHPPLVAIHPLTTTPPPTTHPPLVAIHPLTTTPPPPPPTATTPPPPPATTTLPAGAGSVKSGNAEAVGKVSPEKESLGVVESKLMSASAHAAAVAAAVAAVAANAAAANAAAEESGKDLKVLPTKEPEPELRIESAAPVAPAEELVVPVNIPAASVLYSDPIDSSRVCSMNPCRNGGICMIQPFGIKKIFCRCLPGFFGEYCQYDAPECEMDPCLNNGGCRRSLSDLRGYECRCAYGYAGDNCEIAMAGEIQHFGGVNDSFDEGSTTSASPVQPSTSSRNFFRQWPFLAMVSVSGLLLLISMCATIDVERKIVLERYTVLRAHGYNIEYPDTTYTTLGLKHYCFICCICCAVCPCFDALFLKEAEDEEPLSELLKKYQAKGYTAVPQTGSGAASP